MDVRQLLDTRMINVGDLHIRYCVQGAGSDVVLLHGFPETLQCWYAVMPELARTHRVHAFDWPGFGHSSRPYPWDYSPRSYASFLDRVIRELKLERPSLVGTDIGMLPALLFGLDHPDRVSKIAVMDGQSFARPAHISWELHALKMKGIGELFVGLSPRFAIWLAFRRGFYGKRSIPKEIYDEFLAMAHDPISRKAGLQFFRSFEPDLKTFDERAGNFAVPLLILWGERDVFVSFRMGEELHRRVALSRLEIIEGAGHFVHMEKPDVVASLLNEFLRA